MLVLEDNGKGFRVDESQMGYALQGMLEPTAALGGKLEIVSAPGAGCRIVASFPQIQHSKSKIITMRELLVEDQEIVQRGLKTFDNSWRK